MKFLTWLAMLILIRIKWAEIVLSGAQMVLLGLRFTLFKNLPKRAKTFPEQVHQGIFHGKGYMYGHETTFSGKK